MPEYWIVDVIREAVEVHRRPVASDTSRPRWRYDDVAVLRPPARVVALVAPGSAIPVADLLP